MYHIFSLFIIRGAELKLFLFFVFKITCELVFELFYFHFSNIFCSLYFFAPRSGLFKWAYWWGVRRRWRLLGRFQAQIARPRGCAVRRVRALWV